MHGPRRSLCAVLGAPAVARASLRSRDRTDYASAGHDSERPGRLDTLHARVPATVARGRRLGRAYAWRWTAAPGGRDAVEPTRPRRLHDQAGLCEPLNACNSGSLKASGVEWQNRRAEAACFRCRRMICGSAWLPVFVRGSAQLPENVQNSGSKRGVFDQTPEALGFRLLDLYSDQEQDRSDARASDPYGLARFDQASSVERSTWHAKNSSGPYREVRCGCTRGRRNHLVPAPPRRKRTFT